MPGKWHLSRVQQIHQIKDGMVSLNNILQIYKHPVTKVALLLLNEETNLKLQLYIQL